MKVIVFNDVCYLTTLENTFNALEYIKKKTIVDDYDSFREELVHNKYDLVIVAKDDDMGALGCEFTRKVFPDIPLFWLSNKREYWEKSYELNCMYFTVKPLVTDKIIQAFERFEKRSY